MSDPSNPNQEPEIEILSSSPEKFNEDGSPAAGGESPADAATMSPEALSPVGDGGEWKAKYDAEREKLVWMAADFDNYKKRQVKSLEDDLAHSLGKLLKDFLGVADNLERALAAMPADDQDPGAKTLQKGVELTLRSFQNALAKHGVTRITALGEKFNPRMHEVMFEEKTDRAPDDTVLEELQAGYLHKDRVLRPTMVKVARNPNK